MRDDPSIDSASCNGDQPRPGLCRMRGEHNLILSSCRQSLLTSSLSTKSNRSSDTCPTFTGDSTTSSSSSYSSSSAAQSIRRWNQEFATRPGFGDFDDEQQQQQQQRQQQEAGRINDQLTLALAHANSISSHMSNLTNNYDEDASVTSFEHCKEASQRNGFHWEKSKMVRMLSTKSLMAIDDTNNDDNDDDDENSECEDDDEDDDHSEDTLLGGGNASQGTLDSIDESVAAVLDTLPPEELARRFLELTQKLERLESKRRKRKYRKRSKASASSSSPSSTSGNRSENTEKKKKKSSSKSKSKKTAAPAAA